MIKRRITHNILWDGVFMIISVFLVPISMVAKSFVRSAPRSINRLLTKGNRKRGDVGLWLISTKK